MTGSLSEPVSAGELSFEPTLAEIREIPAAIDRTVPEEYIDFNGHLTVTRYLELHLRGAQRIFTSIGNDELYRAKDHRSTFAQEHHLRYYGEVLQGHRITVRPLLLGRSTKSLHIVSYLVNEDLDYLACVLELVSTHVDFDTRGSVPWGPLGDRIDAWIADHQVSFVPSTSLGLRRSLVRPREGV